MRGAREISGGDDEKEARNKEVTKTKKSSMAPFCCAEIIIEWLF